MNKKYLQSLTRSIRPGGFRCLPKKRSSDTFKKKDKPPPIIEFPNNDTTAKKRPSVTSITTFNDKPEIENSDKEKPVVIVVVVNKRGNERNAFGENIQSSQREWQSSQIDNNSAANKHPPISSPDYVEYFQRLEELICKCAGQKGFGFNSQNTSRTGNSSNKICPIVTQYQQHPMSTRNYEQRKQLPLQCHQQFKQKQQCQTQQHCQIPQQKCQIPQQQCHIPQQQCQTSQQQCHTPQMQCQLPQQQCRTTQQQSQRCYQPQQQYYQPQQQHYQLQPPQQQPQQCYQPQLYQQQDQQSEQRLLEPQLLQQPQQSINGNDINSTCPLSSTSSKARSQQTSTNGHEYCQFQLPVCVTKSTFRKLESAGINQKQSLGKCLDTNFQYSNESCHCDSRVSEYDDPTRCTCKMNPNCFDYCTCMEKKRRQSRKRKRKTKCKNMCLTPEKPSTRVILRDIGLPNRCCKSCRDVPCSPRCGTRCCNIGGCCEGMW